MKSVLKYAALAFALQSLADVSDWYGPSAWSYNDLISTLYYTDENGETKSATATVSSKTGEVVFPDGVDGKYYEDVASTLRNKVRTDYLADQIDIMINGGLTVRMYDTSGTERRATVSFTGSKDSGTASTHLATGMVVPDHKSILKSAGGMYSIYGWADQASTTWSLGEVLGGTSGNTSRQTCQAVVRTGINGELCYVPIGRIWNVSANVDGESVVTNEATGGALSVKGFVAAQEAASEASPKIPYTDGGDVEWNALGSFFDDSLFAVGTDGKVKLTGYTSTVGQKKYFGTDDSSAVGFHTLPTGYSPDGFTLEEKNAETHTIGVKWPSGDGIFGGTAGGWMAIPAAQGGNGGAIPPDGRSLALVSSGNVTNIQISGWTSQAHCSENLHDLLDGNTTDSAVHHVLCRIGTGSDAEIHYLELGAGKFYEPDGDTITVDDVETADGTKKRLVAHVGLQNVDTAALATNAVSGSSADGILSIRGLHLSASAGKFLKNESGTVTWTDVPQGGVNVKSASGSYVSGTNIVFDTKSDSNVKFDVSGSGDTVTVKIGVYYK